MIDDAGPLLRCHLFWQLEPPDVTLKVPTLTKTSARREPGTVPHRELGAVPLLGGQKRAPEVVQKTTLWWYSF